MNRFVQGRNGLTSTPPPPTLGQVYNQNRNQFNGSPQPAQQEQRALVSRQALGREAKLPLKTSFTVANVPSRPSSTAPPSSYPTSQSEYASQDTRSHDPHPSQQPFRQKGLLEDDTVSTNFDHTPTDNFLEDEYGQDGEFDVQNGDYGHGQGNAYREQNAPQLYHKQDHGQMHDSMGEEILQKPHRTGRFEPQQAYANIPLHSGHEGPRDRETQNPRKRSRSQGRDYDMKATQPHQPLGTGGLNNVEMPARRATDFQGEMERHQSFAASSDEMDSTISYQSQSQQSQGHLQDMQPEQKPDDTPIDPEWPPEKLKNMKYSEVQAMTWETNRKYKKMPKEIKGKNVTLEQKIKYHMDLLNQDCEDEDALRQRTSIQTDFYRSMSTSEWEQAGKWFVGQFGQLMQKVIDKKAEKRAITEKFETELDAREKVVRGKSANFDRKLRDMRTSGEEVLKGNSKGKMT